MKKKLILLFLLGTLLTGCSQPVDSQTQDSQEPTKESVVQNTDQVQKTEVTQQTDKSEEPSETTKPKGEGLLGQIVDGVKDLFQKEDPVVMEMGDGKKEDCLIILRFTINPVFEIYLDDDACIAKVLCMNEDAKTLFTDLDVLGMSYFEGIPLILDAAHTKEYINADTSEIKIETTIQIAAEDQELEEIAKALAEPITQFKEEQDLALEVSVPTPEVNAIRTVPSEDQSGSAKGEPNSQQVGKICNSNGDQIGSTTTYYDANGICHKKVWEYFSGDSEYEEYDANGICRKKVWEFINGNSQYEEYYANGERKKLHRKSADGSSDEILYSEKGIQLSIQVINADGSSWNEIYSENGTIISGSNTGADGSHSEHTYYENGSRKSSVSDDSTSHIEWHYFEDGSMSKYLEANTDGSYHETTYYSNGTVAESITKMGDYYGEKRQAEDGTITYEHSVSSSQEFIYENGELTRLIIDGETITDPNTLLAFKMALGF